MTQVLDPHLLVVVLLLVIFAAVTAAGLRMLARTRTRAAELALKNRELKTLREISAIFSSVAPDHEIFERLFMALQASFGVRALAAVSYEEDPDGAASVSLKGESSIDRRAFLDWLGGQHDFESPFLPVTPVPRVASGAARELVLGPRLTHQVFLPLQTPELIAGLLVVESDDADLVAPQTLQELTVLADHVALSLQDRSLRRQMQAVNERLQSRAEMLQRILEVSTELKAHLTLEHVVASIVREASNNLGFRAVLLFLYDRTAGIFEQRAASVPEEFDRGTAPARVPRETIARWFSERYRISKSYFVSHLDQERSTQSTGKIERRRRIAGAGSWHSRDLLFVPLTAGDQLIGVLQLDQPRNGLVPSLEDVQALEIFGNQAVTAIQSARAYETTRQMSVRDSLTEAFNHRYFQETLYREMTRHERSGQPLALVMLDIDDFKRINDRWGHPVGDIVLKGLVEELMNGVREMDTVARYGGEEFALIFPETTPEKAFHVADRLRTRVASRLFMAPDLTHPLAVTISLGLACFPEDGNLKRVLIERADQALYQAKRSGKNCVVTASSLADLKAF